MLEHGSEAKASKGSTVTAFCYTFNNENARFTLTRRKVVGEDGDVRLNNISQENKIVDVIKDAVANTYERYYSLKDIVDNKI